MKNSRFQILPRSFVGMFLCVVFFSTIAYSQQIGKGGGKISTPDGDQWGYTTNVSCSDGVLEVNVGITTVGALRYKDVNRLKLDIYPEWKLNDGSIIVAATRVFYGNRWILKVLTSNGFENSVYILDYWNASPIIYPKGGGVLGRGPDVSNGAKNVVIQGGTQSFKGIFGDATYVLSTMFLYVYRDSVSSWKLDTTGLFGASINYISLDTSQFVYAATTNGVFKQHPDSNVWHQITNISSSNFSQILVDRRNRIFAANYVSYNGKGTYVSTDNGSSWTLDSAGIGTHQILKLSDDAYGNTYAIANGYNQIYRRMNNTPGWTRIDGGITAITINPAAINSVGGDSVLYAATSFGLYASTDQGNTWTESNAGISAQTFYSFAKGTGGKWFTSTNLAMYSLNPTDTAWSKIYPTAGYQRGLPIFADGLSNIYTFGSGNNNNLLPVYKSTNGGASWNIDTLGKSLVLGGGKFFIDEKGGQHASFDPYSGIAHLYTKPYGGSWSVDTNGFRTTSPNSYSSTAVFASDHQGYLYASGTYLNGAKKVSGQVIRRPIDGGTWVADTVGLSGYSYLDAILPGKNGDMFGTYRPHLLHRSNGVWSNLNTPSIAGSSINSTKLSVDSSGALFAAIMGNDVNYVYRGLGVYFSVDTGTTWKYAGLDSITVNQIVSYGDSTYVATNNGLYILTRKAAGTTGVQQIQTLPTSYALFQNYPNPFNPTTTIRYSLPTLSRVSLKVYNVVGQKIADLVNSEQTTGFHETVWNAKVASGVYFYRIESSAIDDPSKKFVQTRSMLILK
ncbi:MAG: T9SS type A sorting domain-containing protein [Bacteroidota bacterium]|nr:T9SS type A sorting domain-containing protein [Bacteroidota bacterium]